MRRNSLCLALVLAGVSIAGVAQGQPEWLARREREHAEWQAAHPDVEAQLRSVKAQTAALIAAYVPPPARAKYADLRARSAALSASQRRQAQQHFDRGREWYELQDYASARDFFDFGLAIDPANVAALFYRGEIYRREADRTNDPYVRDGYRANAALQMDRVLTLGPNTAEAKKAAMAMLYLEKVTEEADVIRPTAIWRVPGTPTELWDAPYAPRLIVIPAGEYTMGAGIVESSDEMFWRNTATPRRRVRIGYPLAIGKFPVTRGEFAAFLADSQYDVKSTVCNFLGVGPGASWDNPGFPQTDDHPVVCISYDNAMAYTAWLSRKTGRTYRLLSESEWEYAARGGTTTTYYWGDDIGGGHANCPYCGSQWADKGTSPVGSFAPNPFGLFDMAGNAWEAVGDCWNYSYAGAPTDGSAWRAGNCGNAVERGGSFNQRAGASSSYRGGRTSQNQVAPNHHGFRIARVL